MASALEQLWLQAELPLDSLKRIDLGEPCSCKSTFEVIKLASSTIGCAALAASLLLAHRGGHVEDISKVTIDQEDALAEFMSAKMATLDGQAVNIWDNLAGMYRAKDGWLRPHTNWPHHRSGLLKMLDLPNETDKAGLAEKMLTVEAYETADKAMEQGLVLTALRSFEEWDATEQGRVANCRTGGPLHIDRLRPRPPKPLRPLGSSRPLDGVRILDLTRVIAGPTAGRTLATYGADVMWITAPHLPALPPFDADTSRGKRTTQLDLRGSQQDRAAFERLVQEADVLLQAYRPGGLTDLGYSIDRMLELNPDLIYATLSAWGEEGPWSRRKGFDSLVQFAVGINEAEGQAWSEYTGEDLKPRALPCQALDHGAGYLLAFGIEAALLRRAQEGGAFKVEVSLQSTATFLRSLGRRPVASFRAEAPTRDALRARGRLGSIDEGWGGKRMEYVRHSARIDGAELGPIRKARGYRDCEPVWVRSSDE